MSYNDNDQINSQASIEEATIDNSVKYRAVATSGTQRDILRVLTHANSEALADSFNLVGDLFDADTEFGEKTEIIVEITVRRVM